jgi:glycosyltransferase involved in cell wall biosynthesis
MTEQPRPLRVAALIDLPRSSQSGGHVKCWERFAQAAANSPLPLDLTVYFSGKKSGEVLGPRARIRQLPPVFSTSHLKFLPYVPDHTDLAPFHPGLARELPRYDLIHTTDGFFAFARTAEEVSRQHNIPLVTSFHTDTLSYAEIFTRHTIESLVGKKNPITDLLVHRWQLPQKKRESMKRRLTKHVQACEHVLITRAEDEGFAASVLGRDRVHYLRLGIDRDMFGPHRNQRSQIERDYQIPDGRFVVLFVGRLDVGKNIYTLIAAVEKLLAEGLPLHLVTAGIGPAEPDLKARLGGHVSVPGFVKPDDLARLYASADVLALASEVEMRSMAGVEALVSGCPVLVAEKSGVAPLFNFTPAMKIVPSGVTAWTDALREIATRPVLRQNMRAEALAYSRTHLASWADVLAKDLLPVWQKAVGDTRSEPTLKSPSDKDNAQLIWPTHSASGAAPG